MLVFVQLCLYLCRFAFAGLCATFERARGPVDAFICTLLSICGFVVVFLGTSGSRFAALRVFASSFQSGRFRGSARVPGEGGSVTWRPNTI